MNQPFLLHVVERLESVLGKLPASIQKPVLSELTPLKQLFLQQRAPRFVLTGSDRIPLHDLVKTMFELPAADSQAITASLSGIFCWQDVSVAQHGKAALLDARAADDAALLQVQEELKRQPADIFFFLSDARYEQRPHERELDNLAALLAWNDRATVAAKVIVLTMAPALGLNGSEVARKRATPDSQLAPSHFATARSIVRERFLGSFVLPSASESMQTGLMPLLARELPNEARVEMIRISKDRQAQLAVAQTLVKSTAAISAAVGAQPIPLADLPILTTLQLVMVSGIMYISGRDRSMRAAAEFTAALGANVGAGMLLREGTRAVLKFFPGWGNVVCGMVAGAGTYAIGRAATAYFLEGASLRDARIAFRSSRRKPELPAAAEGVTGERPSRTKSARQEARGRATERRDATS